MKSSLPTDIQKEIDINFIGTLQVTEAFLPLLIKTSHQKIENNNSQRNPISVINVTSLAGENFFKQLHSSVQELFYLCCNEDSIKTLIQEYIGQINDIRNFQQLNLNLEWGNKIDGYGCSKLGVDTLTRIWASKFQKHKIMIFAVDPGKCNTQIGPKDCSGNSPSHGASQICELISFIDNNSHQVQNHNFQQQQQKLEQISGKLWWKSEFHDWTVFNQISQIFMNQKNDHNYNYQQPLWISICGVGGCGKTTFLNQVQENTELSSKLIISELSTIDYIFCGGSKEIFLSQNQETKDQLHLQGLRWLEIEQKKSDKTVLFGTHASVVINDIPTSIINDRDLQYVTDIIYLDYDLETVWTRQEEDKIRRRNHPKDRIERWLKLEKECIEKIQVEHPHIRIHTIYPNQDIMKTLVNILEMKSSQLSIYLSPVVTKKCGNIKKPKSSPYIIDLFKDVNAITTTITTTTTTITDPQNNNIIKSIIICRCGCCETFPYATLECNFKLHASSEQYGRYLKICGCGKSKGRICGRPWCDGSHTMITDVEDLYQPIVKPRKPFISPIKTCLNNHQPIQKELTKQQQNQFMTDGYCILSQVIPSNLTLEAIKSINYALSQAIVENKYPNGYMNTTMRPTGNKKLFQVTVPEIMNLLVPLLPYCNNLLGKDSFTVPTEAQLALRFPMQGQPPTTNILEDMTEWHVDDIFDAPLPPFSLLVGIPLNDWKEPWSGNFTLYSGSHHTLNHIILDNYQSFVDNYKFLKHPKLPNPIQIIVNVNDAFFVHPLVAHQAAPNYSPNIRYAIFFRLEMRNKLILQRRILHDIWSEFPGLRISNSNTNNSHSDAVVNNNEELIQDWIKELQLKYSDFPSHRIHELTRQLNSFLNISVSNNNHDHDDPFRGYNDLDLSAMELGTGGIELISRYLTLNPHILTLRLESNEIDDIGANYLSEGLLVNTTLTKLDLFDNKITDQGAFYLSESLKKSSLKNIRMLDFWGNNISNHGAVALASLMVDSKSDGLHDLLINANNLTEEVIPQLKRLFQDMNISIPSKLYIEDCKLGKYNHVMSYSHGQSMLKTCDEQYNSEIITIPTLNTNSLLKYDIEINETDSQNIPSTLNSSISPEVTNHNFREIIDKKYLLNDHQVQQFIQDGYYIVNDGLTESVHKTITTKLDHMYQQYGNLGNNVLPLIPELGLLWSSPTINGAITSLLGNNWFVHTHRHSHKSEIGRPSQTWHRDSTFGYRLKRFPYPTLLLAFYYPHEVTSCMGPTEIMLGSQYYHRPEGERLCRLPHRLFVEKYQNDWKVQQFQILPCPSGTFAFVHPDIWHRGGRNFVKNGCGSSCGQRRHMVKFLFERREFPTSPTWNYDFHQDNGLLFSPSLRSSICKYVWQWMKGECWKLLQFNNNKDNNQFETLQQDSISKSISIQMKSSIELSLCGNEGFNVLQSAFLNHGYLDRKDLFDQTFYGLLACNHPQLLKWLIEFIQTSSPNHDDYNQVNIDDWLERMACCITILGMNLPIWQQMIVSESCSQVTLLLNSSDILQGLEVLINSTTSSIPLIRLYSVRSLGWQQWVHNYNNNHNNTSSNSLLIGKKICSALSLRISSQTEKIEYIQTFACSSLAKFLSFSTNNNNNNNPQKLFSTISIYSSIILPSLKEILSLGIACETSRETPIGSLYSSRYSLGYAIEALLQLKEIPEVNDLLIQYFQISRWCPYTSPQSSY